MGAQLIVLRSTYTAALARAVAAEAHAESLREEVEWLRGKLDAIEAERVEAAKPKPTPTKAADPVMAVIASVAGSDAGRRKRLGALVRSRRKEGASDDTIIAELTHWRTTDDDSQDTRTDE